MMTKKTKKAKNIIDIINIAMSQENIYAWIDYQYLLEDEIKKLSKKIGIQLKVNKRVITTDDIRHAFNKHSLDICPLEWSDFVLIDSITKYYDSAMRGNKTSHGLDTIIYEKIIGDKYFVVEEIRAGRKKLSFKTMYKHNIKKTKTK
jgi:hypothetical protein